MKKTPVEWQAILGFEVIDADGWDRHPLRWAQDWDKPLTFDEFMDKCSESTCSAHPDRETLRKLIEKVEPSPAPKPERRPPFQIDYNTPFGQWEIPLRYYKGWTIQFSVAREKFDCPILCLFNFNSVADLEKAMDRAIQYRETGK